MWASNKRIVISLSPKEITNLLLPLTGDQTFKENAPII